VRGVVALDPLQPFQPSPQIPESDETGKVFSPDGFERLLADMPIGGRAGYRYPLDAPDWVDPIG
jgi:hypothetical protein